MVQYSCYPLQIYLFNIVINQITKGHLLVLCETYNHMNLKKVCQVAEVFDFTAWQQMASSTLHVMAFDCRESLQTKATTWNVLEAIWCQAVKSNISAPWHNILSYVFSWRQNNVKTSTRRHCGIYNARVSIVILADCDSRPKVWSIYWVSIQPCLGLLSQGIVNLHIVGWLSQSARIDSLFPHMSK